MLSLLTQRKHAIKLQMMMMRHRKGLVVRGSTKKQKRCFLVSVAGRQNSYGSLDINGRIPGIRVITV